MKFRLGRPKPFRRPLGVSLGIEFAYEPIDEGFLHGGNSLPDLPPYLIVFPVRHVRVFHGGKVPNQFSRKEESNSILIRLRRIELKDVGIGGSIAVGRKEKEPPVIEILRPADQKGLGQAVPHRHHGAFTHQAHGRDFCDLSRLIHHQGFAVRHQEKTTPRQKKFCFSRPFDTDAPSGATAFGIVSIEELSEPNASSRTAPLVGGRKRRTECPP